MKILSTKKEKEYVEFEVEIDANAFETAKANAKKKIAKNIQIPGFRKGHVPANIINERIPDEQVAIDAINDRKLFNDTVNEILNSKEFEDSKCIDAFAKGPEVVKVDKLPVVKFYFELLPEIKNFSKNDIANIEIPPFGENNVTDEQVNQEIKRIISRDRMVKVKEDKTVAKNNIAVINFKGFVDGKEFAGGSGKNFELEIGSKTFIDNFEEQLIGCKKGDKKDVNVKFPDNYHQKSLAGKEAKFEVEILDVKEVEYPEINKEYLASKNIDASNEEELKKYIKNIYTEQAKLQHQDMAIKLINEEISKKASLDFYPQSLIQMHKNQIIQQYQQEAKRFGFKSLEEYKKSLKVDEAKFDETLNESAKKCLVISLVYEKLIEEFDIKVDDNDIKDYMSKLIKYIGNEKKAKELFDKNKDWCESTILKDKLFKKLVSEAKEMKPQTKAKNAKPSAGLIEEAVKK